MRTLSPTTLGPDMQSLQPAVYTVTQVAKLLGLSRASAYARVQDGSIPSVRIGSRILIPRKAFERLLDSANVAERNTSSG